MPTSRPAGSARRRRVWLLVLAMAVPVPVQLALQRLLPLLPEQHAQVYGYGVAALAALLMCAVAVRFETTRVPASQD